MTFNDLKIFITLTQTQNFAKTAALHHMSPSTLSRQIQKIEEELGQQLLWRDNRQVSLTPNGEVFLAFAQQQWQNWMLFQQQLHTQEEDLSGELKLYCSVTAAYSHLPGILEKFRAYYPKVEIQLTTGDPAQAVHLVQAQQVDLALAGKPPVLPSAVTFHYIDDIALSMIAPRVACSATQLLQQDPINWQQVPFILPLDGIKHPKIYGTVAGHEGIVSMVALGCGLALLPDVVIKNSPLNSQISTLQLEEPITPFELGVCALKPALERPLVRAFWQLLE